MSAAASELAARALRTSMGVRRSAGVGLQGPVDVWRLLEGQNLAVRFTPLHVEGLYISTSDPPLVIVGSERPLVRRVFTGAHELGHHVFGHGSVLDEMMEGDTEADEELLVDLFAGYLLMPPLGVRRAFLELGTDPEYASELDVYIVSNRFGVGYTTLIHHLARTLRFLSGSRAWHLKKTGPKDIRAEVLGQLANGHLVIVDQYWALPTIDVEVGDHIILPHGAEVTGDNLHANRHSAGVWARAVRPGIAQARFSGSACFVRVARRHYEGLLKYRHVEDPDVPSMENSDASD